VYDFGRNLKRILIDKNKIMSEQIVNKEVENKSELYTLLYPVAIFRFFLRKNYPSTEFSNYDADELGKSFYEYLQELNLNDEQKKNVLPKDMFDIVLNQEHPLRTFGFSAAYVYHFVLFIEKLNKKELT
jgi:hypothetical protein